MPHRAPPGHDREIFLAQQHFFRYTLCAEDGAPQDLLPEEAERNGLSWLRKVSHALYYSNSFYPASASAPEDC
jgi:hypothetical protein